MTAQLDVRDGVFEFPTQTGVQVADRYGRRAANAGCAVQIYDVAPGEQFIERLNCRTKLAAKVDLFLDHRLTTQDDGARSVMGFKRREVEIDGAHVVIGVDIEHGGDADFAAEPFDVFDGARMRADKKIPEDLRVSQSFAGEWRHFSLIQVSTDFCGSLAAFERCIYGRSGMPTQQMPGTRRDVRAR